MENFNNQEGITPEILEVTTTLTIEYPIYGITIINKGDIDALVNGKAIAPGDVWTMNARVFQIYKPNTFSFNATGGILKLLINKK